MGLRDATPTNYGDPDFGRYLRHAFAKGSGLSGDAIDRPLIGIANTYSELNPCHRGLPELVGAVKRGVLMAGGLPLEFPTISLGEPFLSPSSMLYRNLMSMDTEEMLVAQPLDGAVLLGGCDKTLPAQLMAAASADIPAILVAAGPANAGFFEGRTLGACTDCRRVWAEFRAGRIGAAAADAIGDNLIASAGTCTVMGTASTMACFTEALGMMLPGGATIPATASARLRHAESTGRRIVEMVAENLRPSEIMSAAAFENGARMIAALGGSTNAMIHVIAIAGRTGLRIEPRWFDLVSRDTPLLANIKPTGEFQMTDFHQAGGIPRLMMELRPLLRPEARGVRGHTVGEELDRSPGDGWVDRRVIRPLESPLHEDGGIALLTGNLAPRGALIKQHAASPSLWQHRGPAVVFTSLDDLAARIDDPQLEVTAESVLVLRSSGPVGAPGMPEAAALPIPARLSAKGVTDMVRISDARMSGTAFGTVVLHVTPESATGGPLAAVQDGDLIELDIPARTINVDLSEKELAARIANLPPGPRPIERGYRRLFVDHVLQADQGCDFDFLVAPRAATQKLVPRRGGDTSRSAPRPAGPGGNL
jgi:dihydroxy-acid dehydratase